MHALSPRIRLDLSICPFCTAAASLLRGEWLVLGGATVAPGRPKRCGRSLAWKHPLRSSNGASAADGLGPKSTPKLSDMRRCEMEPEKGEEDRIMGFQLVGPAAEKILMLSHTRLPLDSAYAP